MKHSPEPWSKKPFREGDKEGDAGWELIDRDGHDVIVGGDYGISDERGGVNFDRVCAAINATRGLSTESLETIASHGGSLGTTDEAVREAHIAAAQRAVDDLHALATTAPVLPSTVGSSPLSVAMADAHCAVVHFPKVLAALKELWEYAEGLTASLDAVCYCGDYPEVEAAKEAIAAAEGRACEPGAGFSGGGLEMACDICGAAAAWDAQDYSSVCPDLNCQGLVQLRRKSTGAAGMPG